MLIVWFAIILMRIFPWEKCGVVGILEQVNMDPKFRSSKDRYYVANQKLMDEIWRKELSSILINIKLKSLKDNSCNRKEEISYSSWNAPRRIDVSEGESIKSIVRKRRDRLLWFHKIKKILEKKLEQIKRRIELLKGAWNR